MATPNQEKVVKDGLTSSQKKKMIETYGKVLTKEELIEEIHKSDIRLRELWEKKRIEREAINQEREEQLARGDYVYIIKSGEFYKIGIASNLSNRLASLQIGNPVALQVVYAKQFKNARKIERYFHDRFKENKLRGEWFGLNDKQFCKLTTLLEKYARRVQNQTNN